MYAYFFFFVCIDYQLKTVYSDYALLKKHIKAIRNYSAPSAATISSDDLFVNIDVSSAMEKSKPLDGKLITPCPTPVHISFDSTPHSGTPPRTPTSPRTFTQPQTPTQGRLRQNITNALKRMFVSSFVNYPAHLRITFFCLDIPTSFLQIFL
jgi:hypothetical protein